MEFKDIPFSEMEAILLVEGVGGFIGFEHIEEVLTLDELLLLHEELSKSKHRTLQMMGVVQGVNIPDMGDSSGDNDLPQELLDAEKAWAEKKKKHAEENALPVEVEAPDSVKELSSIGLGYTRE